MYLKNIFNSKPAQVIATVGSLAFGLYNLYIMGRTDEIEELCDIAEHTDKEGCFESATLGMRRMGIVNDSVFPLKVSKGDLDDCLHQIG